MTGDGARRVHEVRGGPAFAAFATLLAFALLLSATPVEAHEPEELTLVFDEMSGTLTITVRHNVKDRTTHYVSMIEVWVNGAEAAQRTYTSQPAGSFTLRMHLDVNKADLIVVKAHCNLMGTKEQELEVGPGITEAGTNAGRVKNVVMMHAALQTTGLLLAFAVMPGGYSFLRAFRLKERPTGRRKLHAKLGMLVVGVWAAGAAGGLYIVFLTSGAFLGSIHGWLAVGVVGMALLTGLSASPRFRPAGYGKRISTHAVMAWLTVLVAIGSAAVGMMASGMLGV
jgi:hypothetical protein